MALTPEGKVKDSIKKEFKKRNIDYEMIIPSAYGTSTGMSDFQTLVDGKFIVIEAKAFGKVPTRKQATYMQTVVRNGGFAFDADGDEKISKVFAFIDFIKRNQIASNELLYEIYVNTYCEQRPLITEVTHLQAIATNYIEELL